jgi:prepilin-type N-terminal cleavage/methylation domain-containing protein
VRDGELSAMLTIASRRSNGFTLIEIAIVMVVIGLLTGGGISILRVMTERKARNQNMEYLQQAKEAILSFAEINGRLPRPDTGGDGLEDACVNPDCVGFLPFITLNIAPNDTYQRRVKYEISNNPEDLRTGRGNTCGTLRAWNPAAGNRPLLADIGSPTPFAVAAILISGGPMDADGAGGAFDAIAGAAGGNNITGAPQYIRSTPTNTFDDVVVFIGFYELNSKMACTAADVCSGIGYNIQNTGTIQHSFQLNGVPPCTVWNPGQSIMVTPNVFFDIYSDSTCGAGWPSPNTTRTLTYSQQEALDVNRTCATGFNNGNLIDNR